MKFAGINEDLLNQSIEQVFFHTPIIAQLRKDCKQKMRAMGGNDG